MDAYVPATDPEPPGRRVILRALDRVEERLPDIGRDLVDHYRSEIVDYRGLDERTLHGDILATAQRNVLELLAAIRADTGPTDAALETLRRSSLRRVHQGIPLQALLHAYRLWGQVVWREILAVTSPGSEAEREAALAVAGRVMAYVDQLSVTVAQAYLDEVTGVLGDREAVRRDLLEALVSGRDISERMRRRATTSALRADGEHMVLLARLLQPGSGDRTRLREAMARAREELRPDGACVLVGIREDEVVAIYPLHDVDDGSTVLDQAGRWAARLDAFSVGVGRGHRALEGIAASYAEAEEAVRLGTETGGRGRAVSFADVLLDHLLSTSPHLGALHHETIAPLHAYDQARKAQLVTTLRTYFEQGFNLSRSAEQLGLNPNTVVYRLRRIHQITGYDPYRPDQLLVLLLGLKSDRWARN